MVGETSNQNKKNIPLLGIAAVSVSVAVLLSVLIVGEKTSEPVAIKHPVTTQETSNDEVEQEAIAKRPPLPELDVAVSNANKTYPGITPRTLETHFAPNLEGTDIDGELKVDESGQLVVDLAVKDFFDYFLSAVAEVSVEETFDQMFKVIDGSLPPEAALEARALLDNYLSYKEAALELMAQPMLPKDQQTRDYQLQVMEDSLGQMRALRREHMPDEQVDAFFGLEEAYEEYTLASIKIQFDTQLSSQEKATLVQYHRNQLPDVIRGTEERLLADGERTLAVQAAMESPDNSVLIERMDEFGYTEDQQASVIAFKTQQEEFNQRYKEYTEAKKERLADVEQGEARDQALESLRAEFFDSESELTQARVRDLDS